MKQFILTAFAFALTMSMSAAVKIEKTAWKGWPNCYRIANGEVELIVTTDVGPRVIATPSSEERMYSRSSLPQMGKWREGMDAARGTPDLVRPGRVKLTTRSTTGR